MRVLVIAPHPDDETLGCGGTLLKHKATGEGVCWLIMTKAHQPQWSADVIGRKEREIEKVASMYGFERVFRTDFPTVQLDKISMQELIGQIRDVVAAAKPDCVYLNHWGDVHSDHRAVFEGAVSAMKPFSSSRHGVRRLLSYEILSSTDAMPPNPARSFAPNVFSNISGFIDRKLEIMSVYQTEIQDYPLPRSLESIRALARVRGATIGAEFAEAFMLVRELV